MAFLNDEGQLEIHRIVMLAPRILSRSGSVLQPIAPGVRYPLDARVQAVQNTINAYSKGALFAMEYTIVDKDRQPVALEGFLIEALAQGNNELYVEAAIRQPSREVHGVSDAGGSALGSVADGAIGSLPSTTADLKFAPLHESVLEGCALDLHREIADRLEPYFPNVQFELGDSFNRTLDDTHTIRFYLLHPFSNGASAGERPCFLLLPRRYKSKSIEIDLARGLKLTLDSEHYKFNEQDQLVLAQGAFSALEAFVRREDAITENMLEPLTKLITSEARSKASSLHGSQLVDFISTEIQGQYQNMTRVLRHLALLDPAAQPAARLNHAPTWRRTGALVLTTARAVFEKVSGTLISAIVVILERVSAIIARAWRILARFTMWLYRHNITSILFYATGATIMSYILDRESKIIPLLWAYTLIAIGTSLVQLRTSVNVIQKIVLVAYPQVYPLGDTATEIVPAVPETAVIDAVDRIARDVPIDYDEIVKSMVVKPSMLRALLVCIGSLEPVSYSEWSKQVRHRRSLVYDAVRAAIDKKQQEKQTELASVDAPGSPQIANPRQHNDEQAAETVHPAL